MLAQRQIDALFQLMDLMDGGEFWAFWTALSVIGGRLEMQVR